MMLDTETIISCRTAFILYKEGRIDEVKERFPKCVEFVEQHKNLSVDEVTNILTKMLANESSKRKQ